MNSHLRARWVLTVDMLTVAMTSLLLGCLTWLLIAPAPQAPPMATRLALIHLIAPITWNLLVQGEILHQRLLHLRYACFNKSSRQLLGANPHIAVSPKAQLHYVPAHLQY